MVSPFTQKESDRFIGLLLSWFRKTKRDLPWRHSYDPYHVWVSEIMLQQTQMDRGVSYFNRWVGRFPTVSAVADADEDEIFQQWEGLGYYARARNLHKAAKRIANEFNGVVPSDYDTLISLPGIGPYTAAAIASIAGNHDVAVVDANVNRVFARIFDIATTIKERRAQKLVRTLVDQLLPRGKARQYNQALMDFGGLVCTPKAPLCSGCPVREFCRSFELGLVELRPVLKKPKQSVYIHRVAGLVVHDGKIYMQKRPSNVVWGGLWEFPGGETKVEKDELGSLAVAKEVRGDTSLVVRENRFLARVKHQFTHHKITLDCYLCSLEGEVTSPRLRVASAYRWVTPREMDELGCPSGVRKIIEYLKKTIPVWFNKNRADVE